jgi:hypothetical protein
MLLFSWNKSNFHFIIYVPTYVQAGYWVKKILRKFLSNPNIAPKIWKNNFVKKLAMLTQMLSEKNIIAWVFKTIFARNSTESLTIVTIWCNIENPYDVTCMLWCDLHAMMWLTCYDVTYMLWCDLHAVMWLTCYDVTYMLWCDLYAMMWLTCYDVTYMLWCDLYAMMWLICYDVTCMLWCDYSDYNIEPQMATDCDSLRQLWKNLKSTLLVHVRAKFWRS